MPKALMANVVVTASDNSVVVNVGGGGDVTISLVAQTYQTIEVILRGLEALLKASDSNFSVTLGSNGYVTVAHATTNFTMNFSTNGIHDHIGFDGTYKSGASSYAGTAVAEALLIVDGTQADTHGQRIDATEALLSMGGGYDVTQSGSYTRRSLAFNALTTTQTDQLTEVWDNCMDNAPHVMYWHADWSPDTSATDAYKRMDRLKPDSETMGQLKFAEIGQGHTGLYSTTLELMRD